MLVSYVRQGAAAFSIAIAFLLAAFGAQAAPKRVALVIGNSAYQHAGVLANPAADARLLSQVLRRRNFEVLEYTDLGFRGMQRAFAAYTTKLQQYGPETVGLIFYAGHGMQVNGQNFMLPVDANIKKEADVAVEAVSASTLMSSVSLIGNKLNIIVLDACRNNPYRSFFRSSASGLARMDAPVGSLVAFSTAPGMVAADGTGVNSPYSKALAQAIMAPGLKIEDVFKKVRNEVYRETKGSQVPWESSSIFGDFYFGTAGSTITAKAPASAAATAWQAIRGSKSKAVLQAFIKQFPDSIFATFAKARLGEIGGGGTQIASADSIVAGLQPAPNLGNRFRAIPMPGAKPISGNIRWDIYAYNASRSGGQGKRVTYSSAAEPALALPAGDYLVVAKHGNAKVQGRVKVAANQPYGHVFVMKTGAIRMVARMAPGGRPINGNVRWDVYTAETDDRGRRKQITYSSSSEPRFDLLAGKYYVQAKYGAVTRGRVFDVPPGPMRDQDLVLDAGRITLSAAMAERSKNLSRNVRWDVYEAEIDDEGKRRHVTYSGNPKPRFYLAAGKYLVTVKHESAMASREIEITAGKRHTARFVMGAGRLKFTSMLKAGAKPIRRSLRYDVYAAEPDEDGNRQHVTYSTRYAPKFALPVGDYRVVVTHGAAKTAFDASVAAGKFAEHKIVLDAGMLNLTATLADAAPPLRRDVRYDIYRAADDGKYQHVTYSTSIRPRFVLRSGAYRVKTTVGSAVNNADIDIAAGETLERPIVMNAAQIKLVATQGGRTYRRRVRWDVYREIKETLTTRRQHVTYSTSRTPIITLNAGSYVLVMSGDAGKVEHPLTVKAGEVAERGFAVN